ncbi:MAG: hypothetical protein LUE10_07265 [Alistipes sp.]|nr:hypothetical protein [Alistipes sp.]
MTAKIITMRYIARPPKKLMAVHFFALRDASNDASYLPARNSRSTFDAKMIAGMPNGQRQTIVTTIDCQSQDLGGVVGC